jgi:hypothetical protein
MKYYSLITRTESDFHRGFKSAVLTLKLERVTRPKANKAMAYRINTPLPLRTRLPRPLSRGELKNSIHRPTNSHRPEFSTIGLNTGQSINFTSYQKIEDLAWQRKLRKRR